MFWSILTINFKFKQVKGLVDTNKDYKNENHSETNSPKSSPIPPDNDSHLDEYKNRGDRDDYDRHRENYNNNDDYYRKSDSEARLDDEPRQHILGKRSRQRSPGCDSSLITKKPHLYPPRHLSDSQVSSCHISSSFTQLKMSTRIVKRY